MDFSNASTLDGYIQDITFHTGVDTNAYKTADRTRRINQWYTRTVMDVLRAINYEQWIDTNFSAGTDNSWTTSADGTATLNIVSGTRGYQLPTTNKPWIIYKVAVMLDGVTYYEAKPYHIAQLEYDVNDTNFDNRVTKTEPYFRKVGDKLYIYPLPGANVTAGLKIWYVPEPDLFVAADTTQEANITRAFQDIISLGASYDWLRKKDPKQAMLIRQEIEALRKEMADYYSSMQIEEDSTLQAAHQNYE